jgi:hypothetical protein
MKQILLFVVFNLLLFTSVSAQTATAPAEGEGTEANPYQIASLDNLYWLSQNSTYWGSYFEQTADIDASETSTWDYDEDDEEYNGFSPIGNLSTKFTGEYDGGNYTIDGLIINRSSSTYVGLFGFTYGATIKNIGVTACEVVGSSYVGGLVGYINVSTIITNCYTTGSLYTEGYCAGGLVAYSKNSSSISNSYSSVSVFTEGSTCGGFVGKNYEGCTISNCYSTGIVNGDPTDQIGGFVGSNYGTITSCFATGTIAGCIFGYNGNFVGYNNDGVITNCYYNTDTQGESVGIGVGSSDDVSIYGLTSSEMKNSSNFTDWDFSNTWEITEDVSFPRLIDVNDVPVFLTTLSTLAYVNQEYSNAVEYVSMDNENVTLSLVESPTDMVFSDQTLTWTPSEWGVNDVTISATDENGLTNVYCSQINVIGLEGSGTDSDPYQIGTLDDLLQLSSFTELWDYSFIQTANIDASETSTWNDGEGMSTIGDSYYRFVGDYDGDGYVINELSVIMSDYYAGLFGFLYGGSISNLGVTNISVEGTRYVGGLVAYVRNGTVSNCFATGTVYASSNYAGGLVGYSYSSSTISNCYAVTAVEGIDKVGGLVGYNYSSSSISNCYATGSVTGEDKVGGLLGYNYNSSTISNCYASGDVSADSNGGGLIGSNESSSTVSNSYYNNETCGVELAIGTDDNSQTVTGLTTQEMKQSDSFTSLDFINTWAISADNTYPALLSVSNNAPFAFADSFIASESIDFSSSILSNDYDYETVQVNLIYEIVSDPVKGSISEGVYTFDSEVSSGEEDEVTYRVGEVVSDDLTIWGNEAVMTFTQSVSTAINELTTESISVYPNPATSTLNIEGSTGIAYVYNLAGTMVLTQDLSQSTSMDISDLTNGVYLLKVDGEIIKVVKK